MEHYFTIDILPDPEFAPTILMNALYSKLHRALARLRYTDIGISFPAYSVEKKKVGLGRRIRLHGNQKRLEEFKNSDWLIGMRDHIKISDINPIPAKVQHVVFRRVQTTSNADRIRRRQMARHNLTYQQAVERIPDAVEKRLELPFVTIKSHSTDQTFRLFIKQTEVSEPVKGDFNAYGLSKEATVPLF
jgi:CRISPR-associated endonuclease Csy4